MFATKEEWQSLRELQRNFFIDSDEDAKVGHDYWRNSNLLELYDKSFAQRISWKWDAVLQEHREDFAKMSWLAQTPVVDFACGSGVASRSWLSFLGEIYPEASVDLELCDRSLKARQFAAKKIREMTPCHAKNVVEVVQEHPQDAVVLSSHVLNELEFRHVLHQGRVWGKAKMVIAIEAGTPAGSKALRELRKVMLDTHQVIGPCYHQQKCPLENDATREKDWCHFFVKAPAFVFQDAGWRAFSEQMGADLRRQPLSYLVMVRKDLVSSEFSTLNAESSRLLGVVKEDKAGIEGLLCRRDGTASVQRYVRRDHKDLIKKVLKVAPWRL